jgi:hypothetical protein
MYSVAKFVVCDGTVMFSLDNQWMATMIAKKHKGDFDTYFFVIDNFIKHANAKGYNRHVATGAMQSRELLLVGQEALGLLLLEKYRGPWKQLMEYMKQGESTIPSNVKPAKTKYMNPGQKKMPWAGRVREWSNTTSYTKRCIRTDCQVKDRYLRLNSKRK